MSQQQECKNLSAGSRSDHVTCGGSSKLYAIAKSHGRCITLASESVSRLPSVLLIECLVYSGDRNPPWLVSWWFCVVMKKHRQATQKELIGLAGLWDRSHGDGITLISSLLTPQPPSNHMPLTAHRVTFTHLLCTHTPPGCYSWCLEIATSDQVLRQYY